MDAFGLVLTIVVLLGVALFILLFERKRATRIQHDLREMADGQGEGQKNGRSNHHESS
jgi:hypothetical protein